jgi:hypothetical protein
MVTVPVALKISKSAFCICGLCILSVNMDYVLKQRQQIYVCNGDGVCSLWGTELILKYYLDKLRLQGVNYLISIHHLYNKSMNK